MTHPRSACGEAGSAVAAGPAQGRLARWDTLGLRLFALMWIALVASHFVAFSVVTFGAPRPGPPPSAPAWSDAPPAAPHTALPTLPSLPPGPRLGAAERPGGGPGLPLQAWVLDYAIRLLVIGAAAWWGSRWLARPMRRLVRASAALDPALARGAPLPQLDAAHGTHEVREAAAVFNRMAEQLQARFEERGLMIAAISHDLRTPLTRLRLRLENAELDAAVRERCGSDIAGMDTLIDSVLEVFRPQDPAAAAAAVPVDLAALAQSAVDDLADGGADAAFDGGAAVVVARPLALRRVLDNLLGNALRYAGAARVRVEHDGALTRLIVEDRGPGIPDDELERMLQPFRRLDASRNRATGGTGLGLYIANELARREGAALSLRNRAGGGLQAELRWPVTSRSSA